MNTEVSIPCRNEFALILHPRWDASKQALFLEANFNIVIPNRYSKYAHPFRISTNFCTHLSLSHACYMPFYPLLIWSY